MLIPARTEGDAIKITRAYWGSAAGDVLVETIREPEVGWLGFGRRDGLYRVVRTLSSDKRPVRALKTAQAVAAASAAAPRGGEEFGPEALADLLAGVTRESADAAEVPPASPQPGRACVRDGRLEIVGDAVLIAPEPINLYVNGKLRRGTTAVRESDEVRVELPAAPPADGFSVSVTPDELWAMLEIRTGRSFRVRDAAPARPLLLEIDEVQVPPAGLTPEAVRAELDRLGIVHGVDEAAIERAVRNLPSTPVVVARGSPPKLGRPAQVTFTFEIRPERRTQVAEGDRVDHRGVLHVPTVEAGDVLARRLPGEAGEPGRTVRGKELPCPSQGTVVLSAGTGARIEEDGSIIRAAVTGRPQVEESTPGRYHVRVMPVLTHGTVDLASGNVEFNGDIVIQGNAEESMRVVAGGDVTVYGSVSRAHVEAAGRLRVLGNSFNSTLVAGGRAAFFLAELPLLERLAATFDTLRQAITQVQAHPAFEEAIMLDSARFAVLVRLLVRTRVRELPGLMNTLRERLATGERRDPLSDGLRAMAGQHAIPFRGVEFAEGAEIEAFRQMLMEAVGMARAAPQERVNVELRYAHNCRVEALGDIRVGGEGSYYSDFHAGGRFRSAGPVRGGRVFGQQGIEVSEAGSEIGVVTELATSGAGIIRLGRVYPGVVLRIGRRTRGVEDVREGVVARLVGDDLRLL